MAPSPRPTHPGYPRTGGTGVPAQPDFPALERGVLDYWEAGDTFRQSIRQRPADDEFVFYDGPPFANGLPHYGHLITGYVKDLVPRFRTMQRSRVDRSSDCDCPPLSGHERRMGSDTCAERRGASVAVRFRLETGEWLLAWTTTPWTLPSNLACAVGADIGYVVVEKDGERYILAADRQGAYERELEGAPGTGTLTGAELARRRYGPPVQYRTGT